MPQRPQAAIRYPRRHFGRTSRGSWRGLFCFHRVRLAASGVPGAELENIVWLGVGRPGDKGWNFRYLVLADTVR
jgi:hypothetical protein